MHPHTQRWSPATDSGAPSASGGGLLAALSLDTAVCTHSSVHTLARSHRGCPRQLGADSHPRCPVPGAREGQRPEGVSSTLAPVLSRRAASGQAPFPGPAGVPVAWPFCSKAGIPSSGESRLEKPGVWRAVTRRGQPACRGGNGEHCPRPPGRGSGRRAFPGTQASDLAKGA